MNLPTQHRKAPVPEPALAYLRSRDPDGITPQRNLCQQAADRLVAEYIDIGGATATRRPGLDGLLARLHEEPAVRYVLVAGLDRLSRNTRTFLDVSAALIESEVSLVDAHGATVIGPRSMRLPATAAEHITHLARRARRGIAPAGRGG